MRLSVTKNTAEAEDKQSHRKGEKKSRETKLNTKFYIEKETIEQSKIRLNKKSQIERKKRRKKNLFILFFEKMRSLLRQLTTDDKLHCIKH